MRSPLLHIWRLIQQVPARAWTGLLLLLVVIFVIRERAELDSAIRILRTARLSWTLLLFAMTALLQVLVALKNRLLFGLFGAKPPMVPLMDALLRRNVTNTVLPFGSAPATIGFANRMRAFGIDGKTTGWAWILYSSVGHASFALVMIPTLIWLAFTNQLTSIVLIGALCLLAISFALLVLLGTVLLSGGLPGRIRSILPGWASGPLEELATIDLPPRRLAAPFTVAISADVLGIAMVWAAMHAVRVDASFGVAAATYVVGTIFVLIAPAFQGLGIAEVSMTVALQRLGLSTAEALGSTVLYRTADIWAPLTVGIALQIRAQDALRRIPRNLPAIFTGMTGIVSVLSVLAPTIPERFDRLEEYGTFRLFEASRSFSLVAGTLLIALSVALWRRRYTAWWSTIALLLALIITHIFKRHDQIVAVLAGFNLLLLIITRAQYRIRSDIPTIRRGIVLLIASLLFAIAYGTLGFWLLDRREFGINFTIGESVEQTIRLFFNLGDTDLVPRTRYAHWFLRSVSLVGVVAVVIAFVSLLRPVVWRTRIHPAERADAQRLIATYGRSALDAFKGGDDKLFFFSTDRQGVVSFGLNARVAVSLGDPTCPPEHFPMILREFLSFCESNAWIPAFHQVPPDHLGEYRAADLRVLALGSEAIVDLNGWSLSGHGMKGFRSAVNRLQREGYSAVVHEPPLPDDVLGKLQAVSDAWLTLPGRRERGFTLGRWDAETVRSCPVLTLETSTGEIAAFINVVADGVTGEGTFDMMRHRPDAPGGAMDALFVALAAYFQEHGKSTFSLGMVPFHEVGDDPDDPMLERAISRLVDHMDRFFSYRGLSAYKDKFNPRWEPRYLVYPSGLLLPQVALAIVRLTEEVD